jgi:hypothetical protein
MMPGESDVLLRWHLPSTSPAEEQPPDRLPYDQTRMEILQEAPAATGRGAAMAFQDDAVYVLRGGETRDFWRFSPDSGKWEVLTSLPGDVSAPGRNATGLVAVAGGLLAFPDKSVWKYDTTSCRWSKFAEIPFPAHWDGGMVAADPEGGYVYVVAGNISIRWGRLYCEDGRFEELTPRLPDVVSAEGNRLVVTKVGGVRRLFIHRGHDSNEVWFINLDDVGPLPK